MNEPVAISDVASEYTLSPEKFNETKKQLNNSVEAEISNVNLKAEDWNTENNLDNSSSLSGMAEHYSQPPEPEEIPLDKRKSIADEEPRINSITKTSFVNFTKLNQKHRVSQVSVNFFEIF